MLTLLKILKKKYSTVDDLYVATKKVVSELKWDDPFVVYLELFRKIVKTCLKPKNNLTRTVSPNQTTPLISLSCSEEEEDQHIYVEIMEPKPTNSTSIFKSISPQTPTSKEYYNNIVTNKPKRQMPFWKQRKELRLPNTIVTTENINQKRGAVKRQLIVDDYMQMTQNMESLSKNELKRLKTELLKSELSTILLTAERLINIISLYKKYGN
jgi:hypothetical protein